MNVAVLVLTTLAALAYGAWWQHHAHGLADDLGHARRQLAKVLAQNLDLSWRAVVAEQRLREGALADEIDADLARLFGEGSA
jgi:hypothetical protein